MENTRRITKHVPTKKRKNMRKSMDQRQYYSLWRTYSKSVLTLWRNDNKAMMEGRHRNSKITYWTKEKNWQMYKSVPRSYRRFNLNRSKKRGVNAVMHTDTGCDHVMTGIKRNGTLEPNKRIDPVNTNDTRLKIQTGMHSLYRGTFCIHKEAI